MPWYRTDNIHLQWTEWENNAHYMGVTPHQATSSVTTQRRTIRKASMLRRGIAAEFEHDFVQTALGRTSFMASLGQIARSVQETANVEVLRALLGCHRFQQAYVRNHGIVKNGELDLWWQRKAERFMICQKGSFGMEHMNTFIDQDQEKYQARSNVWILGREIMDYCSNVPPGKIYYYEGGQEAVDRINGRPQNGVAAAGTMGNIKSIQPERLVAGCPVFLAKSYVVDSVGQADLLSRTVEVGVFNTQIDRTRDFKLYKTDHRAIRVYDNTKDDWAELSLQDAIENNIIWDTDGNVADPFSRGTKNARQTEGIKQQMANDFLRFATGSAGSALDLEYVGDLGSEWISTAQLIGGGQTVLNALERQGILPGALSGETMTGAGGGRRPDTGISVTAAGGGTITDFQDAITTMADLLGSDNLFFEQDPGGAGAGSNTANNLYRTFRTATRPATTRLATPIGTESVDQEALEETHRGFLTVTMGSALPNNRRGGVAAIAERPSVPWKERAADMEKHILAVFAEDPASFKSLKSAESIKQWAANRIESYETKLQEREAAAAAANAAAAATATVGDDLNAAPKKRFPTSLRDMPWMSHVFEGNENPGGRRGIGARVRDLPSGREQTAALASRFNNVDKHILAIANSSAPQATKWAALFFLGCRFSRSRLLALADADIWVPLNALHLRPHATYRTRYGIKCADNGDSGYTFFGHSDMQIEHEAARKVGMMHYTAYLSAVVMNPKNVYVVEDLFCEKYLGGMCTRFWSVQDYLSKQANRRTASIICTALPPLMKDGLEKKIDVRGHWYTEQRSRLVDAETFARVCYPGAARTAAIMGWWDPLRQSKGLDQSHRSRSTAINFVCWQGVQFARNPKTYEFSEVTIEQGNFGPNVYPGCGVVRDAGYKFLEKPAYLGLTSSGRIGN